MYLIPKEQYKPKEVADIGKPMLSAGHFDPITALTYFLPSHAALPMNAGMSVLRESLLAAGCLSVAQGEVDGLGEDGAFTHGQAVNDDSTRAMELRVLSRYHVHHLWARGTAMPSNAG